MKLLETEYGTLAATDVYLDEDGGCNMIIGANCLPVPGYESEIGSDCALVVGGTCIDRHAINFKILADTALLSDVPGEYMAVAVSHIILINSRPIILDNLWPAHNFSVYPTCDGGEKYLWFNAPKLLSNGQVNKCPYIYSHEMTPATVTGRFCTFPAGYGARTFLNKEEREIGEFLCAYATFDIDFRWLIANSPDIEQVKMYCDSLIGNEEDDIFTPLFVPETEEELSVQEILYHTGVIPADTQDVELILNDEPGHCIYHYTEFGTSMGVMTLYDANGQLLYHKFDDDCVIDFVESIDDKEDKCMFFSPDDYARLTGIPLPEEELLAPVCFTFLSSFMICADNQVILSRTIEVARNYYGEEQRWDDEMHIDCTDNTCPQEEAKVVKEFFENGILPQ